jgi:hypothetical protein
VAERTNRKDPQTNDPGAAGLTCVRPAARSDVGGCGPRWYHRGVTQAERDRSPATAAAVPTGPRPAARPTSHPALAGLLGLQRAAGNAATVAYLDRMSTTRSEPRATSVAEISAAEQNAPAGSIPARAGSPAALAPPTGVRTIQDRLQAPGLGIAAGLTLIQHSGAFTAPAWLPDARPQRTDAGTQWQPSVAPAQATDVSHDSFFPAAGDHDRFAGTSNIQQIDGRTWRHVLRITADQSDQVRRGEQEHLNDAALAFQLTYQRIAAAITEVASLALPPRPSRDEAIAALVAALALRVPGLGTDPAAWPGILDRLLSASSTRDTLGLHNVATGASQRDPAHGLIVWPLDTGGLRLGTPSDQIVTL